MAVHDYLDDLGDQLDVEIVSGGARGVDTAAKNEALDWGLAYKEFPADWNARGRGAGFARNQLIVNYADRVVAFWDGVSPGTKDTIDRALKAHTRLEVIFPYAD